jgi:N-glycosyltransferase StaG
MARVLLTVWPFPTHLHPFVAVAHALKQRGHEVVFYTAANAKQAVEGEGFRLWPFRDVAWNVVRRTVDELIEERNLAQVGRRWEQFLVDTLPAQIHDLEALLGEWKPDVLVCDIAMWAPILVLHHTRQVPVAALSHVANAYLPGRNGPIPGIALPRERNWPLELFARLSAGAVKAATYHVRRKANGVRRAHGLPAMGMTVPELTATMPLYLIPSAPELDGCRTDLPASVHYVGPCLWDKNSARPRTEWLRDWRQGDRGVVVEEGALYVRDPRILRLAARGLGGIPRRVVLLGGHGRNPAELKMDAHPQNVTLHPWTPLSDVLPFADLVVTNGNSESVLAALAAGIPLVVLPSIWDQAELAWRIHETRTGLRLPPRRATPEHMRDAVQRVLHEPAFRENAGAMRTALMQRGGPAHAAELIERLLIR